MTMAERTAAAAGPGRGTVRERFTRTFIRFGRPALLLVPVVYALVFLPRAGAMDEGDAARAYLQAGEAVREGRSMYEPLPPAGPHRIGNYYLYPPPLGALVAVLPRLGPDAFQAAVLFANVAAMWVFSWSIARLAGFAPLTGTAGIALLILLMPGVAHTVAIGNIDPIVYSLVAVGLVAGSAGSGAALAAGAALKVTPVWPLGVLLARERRSWIGATAVGLACALVVVLATGLAGALAETRVWAGTIAPILAQGQFDVLPIIVGGEVRHGWFVNGNISPAFAPLRLFLEEPPPGQSIPGWARAYLSAMQFGVPALTAWLTRTRRPREQAAFVIAAATLASPIMRGGYLPVLLVVPAALLGRRRVAEAP